MSKPWPSGEAAPAGATRGASRIMWHAWRGAGSKQGSPMAAAARPETPLDGTNGGSARVRGVTLALRCGPPLLYLAVALAFSWPLPLQFRSAVFGSSGDVWPHLWWLWWVREALGHGWNPYTTNLLFHPFGAPLYLMGMDLVSATIGAPLQSVLGLVGAFNTLMIVAAAFSAYSAYLLALEVTASRAGALVAGAIFGFAPLQSSFGNMGQLELVSVGFVPLTLLCLLRLRPARGRAWLPGIVLAAMAFGAASLSSWYQAMMLGLSAICLVAFVAVVRALARDRAGLAIWLARVAGVGVLTLLLLSPVLVPAIREARGSGISATPRDWIVSSSLDLTAIFSINGLNPLTGSGVPFAVTLGYAASLLAAAGLWRGPRDKFSWAGMLLVFLLLALGPYLRVGSRRFDLAVLPYNALYNLPLGSIARAPVRFMVVVTLAESVLAAWGVEAIHRFLAARWPRPRRVLPRVVTVVVLSMVLLEWLPVPRALAPTPVPAVYQALAGGPPGGLLELPYDAIAREMYWQTSHGRPITGGYISRKIPYPLFDSVPVIRQLRERADNDLRELASPDIVIQPPVLSRTIDILNAYDLRYVLIHKDQLRPWEAADLLAATSRALPDNLIVLDDASVRVYQIPQRAARGTAVGFGGGWYSPEQRAGTAEWFRWTRGAAILSITRFGAAPRPVELRAFVFAYGRPIALDVLLDGKLASTITVPVGGVTIAVPTTLSHGYNGVELRAREPALRPVDLTGARDNRSLSFGVSALEVVPK